MNLIERFKARRVAKKEDQEATAREQQEERRAGDDPPRAQAETVGDVAGTFPPPS